MGRRATGRQVAGYHHRLDQHVGILATTGLRGDGVAAELRVGTACRVRKNSVGSVRRVDEVVQQRLGASVDAEKLKTLSLLHAGNDELDGVNCGPRGLIGKMTEVQRNSGGRVDFMIEVVGKTQTGFIGLARAELVVEIPARTGCRNTEGAGAGGVRARKGVRVGRKRLA